MGRVKRYSRQHENKHRRSASMAKKLGKKKNDSDNEMEGDAANTQKKTQGKLSIAKRRQIFKKSKDGRREVKKRILELKMQSKKLHKRNLD